MKTILASMILLLSCTAGYCQMIRNHSVEEWGLQTTCSVNTTPNDWVNFSNSGIGPDEANFAICPSTIPNHASDRITYARMLAGNPFTGEGMQQSISGFSIGTTYTLLFDYAGSNLYGGNDDICFHVFLDGVDINTTVVYHSSDTLWTTHAFQFTATDTVHTIGVRCVTSHFPSAGGSGGIDNFRFQQITGIDADNYFPEVRVLQNQSQNTFTVNAQGDSEFEISVFDITGRRIVRQFFLSSVTFSTEPFSKGMYVYEIRNRNGNIKKGKIVKE